MITLVSSRTLSIVLFFICSVLHRDVICLTVMAAGDEFLLHPYTYLNV
jgi:hypothetical protein